MRAVDEPRKNLTREIINPGKKYLEDGDKPRKNFIVGVDEPRNKLNRGR